MKHQVIDKETGEIMTPAVGTDAEQFISELDGGVFIEKLGAALSEVAAAVIDTGGLGRVRIDLAFKQLGNGHQVIVAHKLAFERPTMRGKRAEEDTTSTPMHVGRRGSMSLFPEDQHLLFDKTGAPVGNTR
jgi:hypothetical protein